MLFTLVCSLTTSPVFINWQWQGFAAIQRHRLFRPYVGRLFQAPQYLKMLETGASLACMTAAIAVFVSGGVLSVAVGLVLMQFLIKIHGQEIFSVVFPFAD